MIATASLIRRTRTTMVLLYGGLAAASACSQSEPADLLLVNARVYTLNWDDPDGEGRPAANAPFRDGVWRPDAEAIAIKGDRILFAGSRADADKFRGENTVVRDVGGATVLPGLIESHVHLENLGASLERVHLVGVKTPAEAIERVVARAQKVPKGEWIIGWGWDEGAWASNYPDMRLLSERVPDHPVLLHGLHTFASWGNQLAFDRAGIGATTVAPVGGEIKKDERGRPTGILMNNATHLIERAIPPPTLAQTEKRVTAALQALAAAGYVYVQEAGATAQLVQVLEDMSTKRRFPIRVDVMLAARDTALLDAWAKRGPRTDDADRLVVRSVKAFYDGAMGSRGAYFLSEYSDQPGHRGTGGADYGFDASRMSVMARAGFQLAIHAIGDRANRETLDFVEHLQKDVTAIRESRPRIEHAQVVDAADMPRFASLGVIASMQPSHAVEDMPWAEARVGSERIKGAYAWRSLRRAGAQLAFNSDLPATDYNFFYGLHSAVTRQDRNGQPAGGWRADERLTIEEAIRGWTTWGARATFQEGKAGALVAGRRADLTVMDIDPFQVATTDPRSLPSGTIVATIVDGR